MKNILKIYNNSWNIIIKNIVKIKLVNKIKWLIKKSEVWEQEGLVSWFQRSIG